MLTVTQAAELKAMIAVMAVLFMSKLSFDYGPLAPRHAL